MVLVQINGEEVETRELIRPPYIECPQCHKQSFGVLHVGLRAYLRACHECPWPDAKKGEKPLFIRLPSVEKKVVYLDQHVISGMAKALRPELQRTKMEEHVSESWIKLFHQIDRLRRLQLIVCPYSMLHRRESFADDRLYKYLKALYKRLSNGVEFFEPMEIQSVQIMQFAQHHLDVAEPVFVDDPQQVVTGRINSWERYSLKAGLRDYDWKPEYGDLMRKQNEKSHQVFQTIYDRWKQGGMTIEQRIEEESKSFGETVRRVYALLLAKQANEKFNVPIPPEIAKKIEEEEVWEEHPYIKLVDKVSHLFSGGSSIVNPYITRYSIDFLAGDALRQQVPSVRLSPLLWATLARQAAAAKGRKETIDTGDDNDISVIAHLLPYCDAIVIDNAWRGRLRETPAKQEVEKYRAKVFSRSNLPELVSYLDEVEKSLPEGIRQKVQEVYGDITEEDPFAELEKPSAS